MAEGATTDAEMREKYADISYFVKCGSCGFQAHNSMCDVVCLKCNGNMVKIPDPVGKR